MTQHDEMETGSAQSILPPRVQPAARGGELPLSFAQQRLWFLDQLEPGSAFYNLPAVMHLNGLLNIAALEKALNEIVARHEILRTTFGNVDGRPVQRVAEALRLEVPLVKLTSLPATEQAARVQQLIDEAAQRPFNLAEGPLLRVQLLQLSGREYVLLMTMHHIISDGWSMGVLMREMGQLYIAYVNGRPSPLAKLPLQYADYAIWQQHWLRGEVLENHLDFWRRQLTGAPVVLELPADSPRPPVQTHGGANLRFELPGELSQELNALGQREGATLFMVLFAAYAILIYRYTGQEDFLTGTPIANRNRSEVESLIGFFVNMLVLRTKLTAGMSVLELLRQVREVTLGAYAHQDVPFEKLVDEFQPERDMSRAPLFQVMFALQNAPMSNVDLPGLKLKSAAGDSGASKFDLSLYIEESPRGLSGTWEYSTDIFGADTISRLSAHFATLLKAMVSDPQQRLAELALMSEAEQHQLLVEWNDTRAAFPMETCLHQLFEQQAARTPEHVAVADEHEQLTYGELNRRADQLARRLRLLGVGPEACVALLLQRSVEMMVALLGVLKAGGAYVPLDPNFPPARLSFMLEDSRARVLLTQRRLAGILAEHSTPTVYIEEPGEEKSPSGVAEVAGLKPEQLAHDVGPENLAYVIYTSGSTGTPKGVAIAHRSIVNFLSTMRRRPALRPSDCLAAVTTLSFDISLLELFLPLAIGARVEVVSRAAASDGRALAARLAACGATVMQATPATWRLLLAAGWSGALKALCGGERLTENLAEELAARAGEVWNMYGPTETTVWSSVAEVKGDQARVSLGHPIANTQFYVLSAGLRPVPVGVAGELYIGGEGVARGYLNRPALTAEKFVPDSFSAEPGARLYRTGDTVRYLPGGELEYVGRADAQVKVRGYRIELGEIEVALREHEGTGEACVLAREDAAGGKRLVAYLVADGEQRPTTGELRAFLQGKLPDYMIPSAFITLDELPLTPNGKVDRRALPEPGHERPELGGGYVAPRTAAEVALAGIWSEVLGVEEVGVHDNFFELGGDSILTIQIVSKAEHAGLSFAPRLLFQHQTIAELAVAVNPGTTGDDEQEPIVGPVWLTPTQRRFFEAQDADPHHFNMALMLEAKSPPDRDLLRLAFQHLHLHHDALRLRFEPEQTTWRQFNEAPKEWGGFSEADLCALPPAEQTATIAETAASVHRSLNLSEGPLLKAVLFKLGAGQAERLLLVAHRLIVDWVSWRILLDDLHQAYAQLSRGENVSLGPKASSFRRWAGKLKEYAESDDVQPDYWLDALKRPLSPLPVDFQGDNTAASAHSLSVRLEAEETRALLGEVPAAYRTQLDEVLLTALALSFRDWTGQPLLVDLEGHGREDLLTGLNLTRTVGCLTSFYPVLIDAGDDAMPSAALKRIKEQLRGVPQHGIGYGLMRYMGGEDVANILRALPQSEASFNYPGTFDREQKEAPLFGWLDESPGPLESPRRKRRYLIEINGRICEGRLQMTWTYSRNLHKRSTIERLSISFVEALRELIAHSQSAEAGDVSPSDFPFARLDEDKLDKLAALISSEDESDLLTA
jgi:amino acid adenylation domain-containing protein/non-ribosomal peptide synthase protein (TIGR01720 family)